MKKLLCFTVCAVMVLLFVSECSYAGMDSILHVYIANVEKMTGGNSRIKFSPIDLRKDEPDKERWAYMKYLDYQQNPTTIGGGAMLRLMGSGVKKQSAKIPTEKTGLINPKNPIEIISYSDKVLFGFDMEYHGDYTAKILDSKGKVLASINKGTSIYPNQNKGYAEIKVSPKAEKYYVEVTDGDKNPAEYYYIALTMKATDVKAERSEYYTQYYNNLQNENDEYMSVMQAHMKKHGITNMESLTDKDKAAISDEYRKKKNAGDDDKSWDNALRQMPEEQRAIFLPYMKKHGISSMKDLTTEDWMNLAPELEKLQDKAKVTDKNSKPTKKKRK